MSPRLAFALNAVHRAGRSTLRYFQNDPPTAFKQDETPVTEADREAERLLREAIRDAFPGEPILGEEEGHEGGPGPNRWVLDPIDGTKSFVCGVPLYATLLSYEVEGEPVVGACYLPALDLMVAAEKGQGATANGRPIRAVGSADLARAVICHGGLLTMRKSGRLEGFLELSSKVMATRTWCDAYGHALVAMGRVDAMVDPRVARWDVSAMAIIVREAGGRFTDFRGGEAIADEAISANPALHGRVLEYFRL
jgi:myo-inositol-1(or 4)-monophosphatase